MHENVHFLPLESTIILILLEQVGLWSATWCGHKSTYFDEYSMFFEWLDPKSWNTISISFILHKIYYADDKKLIIYDGLKSCPLYHVYFKENECSAGHTYFCSYLKHFNVSIQIQQSFLINNRNDCPNKHFRTLKYIYLCYSTKLLLGGTPASRCSWEIHRRRVINLF